MRENVKKTGNSMKTAGGFKAWNFAESGEFDKNSQHFHITDFWVNPENDESRVFAKESRDMESALPLHLLVGVDL